jgi:short-subunit dehydrogenase
MADRPSALVTGASSGLGKEFGRLLAAEGYDLILVARSGAAMEELAGYAEERFHVETIVLPKDLGRPGAGAEVIENLEQRHLDRIDVLINAAGFTQYGSFTELDEIEMDELLQVNVVALTDLTRRILPGMLARGRGIVANLSSNAAFQPGPLMATSYASKAYVLSLSLALAEEVRGTGVTVTALCPGPTDTRFQQRASMADSKLVSGRHLPSAFEVASWGWDQAKKGKPFAVHTVRWKAVAQATRLIPRSTAARWVKNAQDLVDRT